MPGGHTHTRTCHLWEGEFRGGLTLTIIYTSILFALPKIVFSGSVVFI